MEITTTWGTEELGALGMSGVGYAAIRGRVAAAGAGFQGTAVSIDGFAVAVGADALAPTTSARVADPLPGAVV